MEEDKNNRREEKEKTESKKKEVKLSGKELKINNYKKQINISFWIIGIWTLFLLFSGDGSSMLHVFSNYGFSIVSFFSLSGGGFFWLPVVGINIVLIIYNHIRINLLENEK